MRFFLGFLLLGAVFFTLTSCTRPRIVGAPINVTPLPPLNTPCISCTQLPCKFNRYCHITNDRKEYIS